jgi:hypothetical protein
VSGIDPVVYVEQLPPPMFPGVARIVVWIALGSASWAMLGTVVMLAVRLVG